MKLSYPQFFEAATGNRPYLWQCRLACGEPPKGANCDLEKPDKATTNWLSEGNPCQSRLIDIPTGLGKTAGVVLAWLWNRVTNIEGRMMKDEWPRRLIYCLPMRTLVEQTEAEVTKWIFRLALAATAEGSPERHAVRQVLEKQSASIQEAIREKAWNAQGSLDQRLAPAALHQLLWLVSVEAKISSFIPHPSSFSPVVLMGGEDLDSAKRDWDLYPEKPAILIGTQDMLLSRALNRGYGMSRYRWPMHFALLNNDCLWVMDEVQLMGAGLASTTQLEGFRAQKGLGSVNCHSWWMSATIRPDWLKTVDLPEWVSSSKPVRLNEEKEHGRIKAMRVAPKALVPTGIFSGGNDAKATAAFIVEQRATAGLNLVVVNTVKRARTLYDALSKALRKGSPVPLLLHSQFRQKDRSDVLEAVRNAPPGQIVVSTQVIEAGIDLSAHTLFTELAPWSSLVQRFGRCNRRLIDGNHHFDNARVFWFDLDADKNAAPYEPEQLTAARDRLNQLDTGPKSAAITHLEAIESPDADRPTYRHVIRRKDLVELFDTTPDLAGADLDIDRFIRDANDSHVHVFWRDWKAKYPNGNTDQNIPQETAPARDELCPTGIADLKTLLGKKSSAYRWNPLDRQWQPVKAEAVFPGQTYLLHISQGGYAEAGSDDGLPTGWTGNPKDRPSPLQTLDQSATRTPLDFDGDPASEAQWQTIGQHTDDVCSALNQLLESLANDLPPLPDRLHATLSDILRHAARWHDWGKAHSAFQAKLKADAAASASLDGPVAKAPDSAWHKGRLPEKPSDNDHRRPHFRHELASALGVLHPSSGFPLTNADPDNLARDLAAYLIASHHGKVRLSIRSLPDEWTPPPGAAPSRERRFARGVWDDDALPAVSLGRDTTARGITLSLEPMELGLCQAPPFEGQPSWAERAITLRDTLGPFFLAYLETLLRSADGRGSRDGNLRHDPTAHEPAAAYGPKSELSEKERNLAETIAAEGLAIQDRFRPEPLYKTTGKGHYESRTAEDIEKARKRRKESP